MKDRRIAEQSSSSGGGGWWRLVEEVVEKVCSRVKVVEGAFGNNVFKIS